MTLNLSQDHPLTEELSSLRAAVALHQHEAHESSKKLQAYIKETSQNRELLKIKTLEVKLLTTEVGVLRAYPYSKTTVTSEEQQRRIDDLVLQNALLREKLQVSEDTLLLRTEELTDALSMISRAQAEADSAWDMESKTREKLEEYSMTIHELERGLELKEEERRLADEVVTQYAALVRKMDGRKSTSTETGSTASSDPADVLNNYYETGRQGLQRLLSDHDTATRSLHQRIDELEHEKVEESVRVAAFIKAADNDRKLLASAQDEIVRIQRDDQAAAQVVSRYMAFSQANSTSLQNSLQELRKRHSVTVDTLRSQVAFQEAAAASSQRLCTKLSAALEELSEDVAREAYGRRREVGLRLALLVREAGLAEGLARWARGAKELYTRLQDGQHDQALDTKTALTKIVQGTSKLLGTLNGDTNVHQHVFKDLLEHGEDGAGALGRVIVAQEAVTALVEDLRGETERRMRAERERARLIEHAEALTMDQERQRHGSILSALEKEDTTEQVEPVVVVSSLDVLHQPTPISSNVAHFAESSESSSSATNSDSTTSSSEQTQLTRPDVSTAETSPHIRAIIPPSVSEDIARRYDSLQRSFQDCHVALKELKQSISDHHSQSSNTTLILVAARRLEDFNEDVRVELEIRIADEERTIKGWETILSIPGAVTSDSERQDIEKRLESLSAGTEAASVKAMSQFEKKLEDVQHDIACLKRALHEQQTEPSSSAGDRPQSPSTPWSAWATNLIRAPTRSSSPIPPQSFGAVITSPRSPSLIPMQDRDRRYSGVDLPRPDPFASLGLRISMPSHVYSLGQGPPRTPSTAERGRTNSVSGMYSLGLGTRNSSYSLHQSMSSPRMIDHTEDEAEGGVEEDGVAPVDIE